MWAENSSRSANDPDVKESKIYIRPYIFLLSQTTLYMFSLNYNCQTKAKLVSVERISGRYLFEVSFASIEYIDLLSMLMKWK